MLADNNRKCILSGEKKDTVKKSITLLWKLGYSNDDILDLFCDDEELFNVIENEIPKQEPEYTKLKTLVRKYQNPGGTEND